jgi:hypothetical protein
MIPDINQFVSDLNYEKLFIYASNTVNRLEKSKIVKFNITISLLIIDLSTESAIINSAKFRMNLINTIIRIWRAQKLIDEKIYKTTDIAIMIPYNKQHALYSAPLLRLQNKHLKLSIQNITLIKIDKFQSRERGVVINNLTVVSDVNFVKSATRIIIVISKTMNDQYIFFNTKIIEILLFNSPRFLLKSIEKIKRAENFL